MCYAIKKLTRCFFPGVSIANAAVNGLSAKQVAEHDPTALRRALGDDTRHVWLTIGGNDAQLGIAGCGDRCFPQFVNQTVAATRAFVAPALAAFPKARGRGRELVGPSSSVRLNVHRSCARIYRTGSQGCFPYERD